MFALMVERAGERRPRRDWFAILLITFHDTEREAQRAGRVGIIARPEQRETRKVDASRRARLGFVHFSLIRQPNRTRFRIEKPRQLDHRIRARRDRFSPARADALAL